MESLVHEHCTREAQRLPEQESRALLQEVEGWEITDGGAISRAFGFKDFYETIAFVNALAWIANREDHHPDLKVSYNRCRVTFTTHSVGGLSRNDFICAARVDFLVA